MRSNQSVMGGGEGGGKERIPLMIGNGAGGDIEAFQFWYAVKCV